jgi:transcriptional regulator with GAF, ATPase, and Fis domain
MRQRDKAAETQRRKTLKRRNAAKAAGRRGSLVAGRETNVAQLTRERDEALEQQAATSEVLRVISRSPTDVQPVFNAIAESATRLCDGHFSFVVRFDGDLMHFAACHGLSVDGLEVFRQALPRPASSDTAAGRAILTRTVALIQDVQTDPTYGVHAVARAVAYRALVAVPLLRDGNPIGAISVARGHAGPFSERQISLLQTFAEQAVIAIENVRLFEAEQQRRRELSESLEQQTATSEVLKVISSSASNLQAVFDTMAENAVRLCEAERAYIFQFDGKLLRAVASYNAGRAQRIRKS